MRVLPSAGEKGVTSRDVVGVRLEGDTKTVFIVLRGVVSASVGAREAWRGAPTVSSAGFCHLKASDMSCAS